MHVAHQIRQGGGHVHSTQLGGANEPPKKMTREEKLQASLEKSQRAAR